MFMSLKDHIARLLFDHSCVVVPGLGGFITRDIPLSNATKGQLQPTRSGVAFNQQLMEEDGLLTQFVAKQKAIGFAEAKDWIAAEVQELFLELKKSGHLVFDPMGTFYRSPDNPLLFVANPNANFSKITFGLPAIKVQSKSQTKTSLQPDYKEKKRTERKRETASVESSRRRPIGINVLNTLGSVFLLAMVFSLLNFEMGNDALLPVMHQEAQIFDTPDQSAQQQLTPSKGDQAFGQLLNNYRNPSSVVSYRILLDGTFSSTEVENIHSVFSQKFPQSEIIELENNEYTISVISFMNEDLANEYRNLIQKNLEYELITTAK